MMYTVLARHLTTKRIRKIAELNCKTFGEARQTAMIKFWQGLGDEQLIVASPNQLKRWEAEYTIH